MLTGIFWRVLSLLIGFDGALSINGFLVLIIVALFFWFIVNWTPFTSRRRHGRQMHLDPELNETSGMPLSFSHLTFMWLMASIY